MCIPCPGSTCYANPILSSGSSSGPATKQQTRVQSQTRINTFNQISALYFLTVNSKQQQMLVLRSGFLELIFEWIGCRQFNRIGNLKYMFCVAPLWLLPAGRGNQSCTHSVTCTSTWKNQFSFWMISCCSRQYLGYYRTWYS